MPRWRWLLLGAPSRVIASLVVPVLMGLLVPLAKRLLDRRGLGDRRPLGLSRPANRS